METDKTPAEQLRDVERAQTAPWVDYPPTTNWYYPTVGLWLAAMCVAAVKVAGDFRWIAAVAVLLALEIMMLNWLKNGRPALPNLRTVPEEFAPLVKWFVLIAILIVASSVGLIIAGFEVIGFALCAIATTVGLYGYEKKFDMAADAARGRLDLP